MCVCVCVCVCVYNARTAERSTIQHLHQWAALANNAAPWRTQTAFGSIIVNSEHGSWL